MKLHNIAIGTLLIIAMMTGIFSFVSGIGHNYDTTDFTGLEKTKASLGLNTSNENENALINSLSDDASIQYDDIQEIPYQAEGDGAGETWYEESNKARDVSFSILDSPNILKSLIFDVQELATETWGIPKYIFTVMWSVITITLTAIFIYAFRKWKMED